jgi:hypothetical protein
LERRRLTLIHAGDAGGFRRVGTGYLIGPRLVLTARHVVEESKGSPWARIRVRVGHPRDDDFHRCQGSVRWTDPEGRDVALLLLDDAADVPGPVCWGRPVGNTPLPYDGLGYPSATIKDGQHTVEHLRGKLPPQAGGVGVQDLYVLDQEAAPDMRADREQAWSGASGSAVFCQDHLVGVVIHDDEAFANRRLHACPARTFTADPAFVELLQTYGDGPPGLVDVPVAPRPPEDDRDPAMADDLRTLRRRVLEELRRDKVQQQLRSGHSLPVHCRAAPAELTGRSDRARETSAALAGASPLNLRGPLDGIAAVYLKERRSQLLVLGQAGSGKSVLVRRFAQARLEDDDWTGKGPVPVIFSPGSWNPTRMFLQEWLVDRLERDHSFLAKRLPSGETRAAELIAGGEVLVILDGFDEMAEHFYEDALGNIEAFELPLLLTSRPEALTGVKPSEGLFPGIELTDLTLDDCTKRLAGSSVWAPVLDRLSSRSGDPAAALLAKVLTTPLMLTMAEAFLKSGGEPASLLTTAESGSQDALEKRLLDAFLPTAYNRNANPSVPRGRRWSAERAGRWLGYLATHLTKQDTQEPTAHVDSAQDEEQEAHTQDPTAHVTSAQDIEWWQLGTTISLPKRMAASGAVCGLVSGAAAALVNVLMDDPESALLTMFLNMLGVGLAFGIMHAFASKIGASGAFRPSRLQIGVDGESRQVRSRRVRERFLPRVGGGLAGGLIFGIVFGAGVAGYAMLLSSPLLSVALIFGSWLVIGSLLGLGIGIVLALVAWLETDTKPKESASPTDLLRNNRTIVLVQAAAVGLAVGLGFGATITYFNGFALGLENGIGGGLTVAIGVGSLTAWGRWVVLVRIWLPLSGDLPWRVNAFLDDARARGVLRQAGAVYQFRHALLRDHLAGPHREHEQSTEQEPMSAAHGLANKY